jgi:uncharacterized membrane protein YbhN (UPF0104 family)
MLSARRVRWAGSLLSLLALVVLVVLLRDADWQEVVRSLAEARIGWLIVAVLLALAVEVVKTVRWQWLLGTGATSLPGLLSVMLTARLLNALVPLRAGDVWRVTAAIRVQERPLVAAGGAVVGEKLLDGIALGTISMLLFWSAGPATPLILLLAAAMLGGAAAATIAPRHGRVRIWLRQQVAAVAHLRDWRVLAIALVLTALHLALGLAVNLTVLHALDIPIHVLAGLVMLVAGYAVGLAPAGPAQVGVFELAVAAALTTVGFAYPAAVTAALVLHLVLLAALATGSLVAVPLGWWDPNRRSAASGRPLAATERE